jgi:predicted RNA-binding protein YlxR (DUF448 family)
MAPVRPEFYYHPAVGVISPTSLGLFEFKSGPLVVTPPLSGNIPAPKPLNRVAPLNGVSAIALSSEIPESEMKKKNSSDVEKCIVTGEELPITEMIRFVVDPENNIALDLSEKLPGNAFWIQADRDVIKRAIWRNSFTTANRAPVNVPKNLLETVRIGLLRQSLETMGLARKAGLLIQGFAKVEEALKAGKGSLYLVASDAKENGREKIEKAIRSGGLSVTILDLWTSSQLSAALGVENAIHAVLTDGALTTKLKAIAKKLKDTN